MGDKLYTKNDVKAAMKLMFQRGVHWLENHNPDTDDGWGVIIDKVIRDCMPTPAPTDNGVREALTPEKHSDFYEYLRDLYCGHRDVKATYELLMELIGEPPCKG